MRSLGGVEIFILIVFCIGALAAPMIVLWVLQAQKYRRSSRYHEQQLENRVAQLEADNARMREELEDKQGETE